MFRISDVPNITGKKHNATN